MYLEYAYLKCMNYLLYFNDELNVYGYMWFVGKYCMSMHDYEMYTRVEFKKYYLKYAFTMLYLNKCTWYVIKYFMSVLFNMREPVHAA